MTLKYETYTTTEETRYDDLFKFLAGFASVIEKSERNLNFKQLSIKSYRSQCLCSKKSNSMCLIVFKDNSTDFQEDSLMSMIQPVLNLYKNDPIQFVYVDKEQERELYE